MNKYRRWTKEEDSLLLRLYNKKTNEELGELFNRNRDKISRRMSLLGVKKEKNVCDKHVSEAMKRKKLDYSGPKNPHWTNGKYKGHGYVFVWTENGYKLEHRIVMERILGRELMSNEQVHHKDRNRENNDPDNLVLCASGSEHHKKYHVKESLENLSRTPSHKYAQKP